MPSAIPISAAPFFQEYTFSQLDAERHAPLVIERILAYGNRSEIRWLFDFYGKDRLRAWISQMGEKRLSKRRYHLWCVLLDVIPIERPKNTIWNY